MNVGEAIRGKRAVRRFGHVPVNPGLIDQVIGAGRRAQSSRNTQPWRFIVVERKETLEGLAGMGHYAAHLADAAAAIVILTPDPAANVSVLFDAGQAAAYMQLQALELGLGSCIVKIHNPEPARGLLGFPDRLFLNFVLAVGYPEDPLALTAPPTTGGRLTVDEIAYSEYWGRSLRL